jgi:sulfatase maturation enzyme AslB (radical SAM superfamily)
MSKEIIKIEPVEYAFRVEMSVGTICNYNCPYCIEKSHRGNEWIDMDAMIKFCEDVSIKNSHRPVTFALCNGGEPSRHPRIIEFMKSLRKRKNNIFQLTTNGSRSLNWWKQNLYLLDHLVMTFHCTECNHDEFFEKVKYISQHLTMTVVIPLYSPVFSTQYEFGRKLAKECDNVFVSFKPLVHKPYEKPYEWSEEQKQYFIDNPYFISEKYDRTKRKAVNMNVRVYYDDNSTEEIRPQVLVAKGLDRFKGWKCNIGTDFLKVDHYGNIYSCDNNEAGNIKGDYTLPTDPVICKINKCNCGFMVAIKKEKPLVT